MAEYFCKVAEHVRANPTAIKYYIFFEATTKRTPFPSYKRMCKKYGSDLMDYQEFEFWFMRFSRGEFDFDYDRSKDPKMRGIQALPNEIIDKIGKNYLNLMQRQILRKVNKHYRALVATWDPGFKFISIEIADNYSILWLDQFQIKYQHFLKFDGFEYHTSTRVISGYRVKDVEYCSHVECALRDLVLILENPKLELKTFYVKCVGMDSKFDELNSKLKELSLKTQRVEIVIRNYQEELAVLPYLNPNFHVKDIILNMQDDQVSDEFTLKNRLFHISTFDRIRESDYLELRICGKPEWFPIEHFMKCRVLVLDFARVDEFAFTILTVSKWRKALLKSPTIRAVHLKGHHNFKIYNFKRAMNKVSEAVVGTEDVRRIKIPDSIHNEYLEIDFRRCWAIGRLDITFEKIKV